MRPGCIATFFIAVAGQRIAERALERLEPGLEVLPLLEPLAKDRLAHLLGAGGAHAALGLVELDALRLELKPAEIEHAPHAALKILDHVLVMHAQNRAPGST